MRLSLRQRASWIAHVFKAATQQHHTELRSVFAPHVPADGVVIDIGAHAGQFSKLFARMAPRGRVYAFEPAAYARSVMAPAVALSGLRNITVVTVGLSDAPAELVLRTPRKRWGSLGFGTAHLGEGAAAEDAFEETITLTTLDAFAAEVGLERLNLIKADVEGWELRALRGGEATLRRFRPALFLEVDAEMLARAGDTPQALFGWLAGLGYGARRSPDLAPAPAYGAPGDYLFRSAESS